MNPDDFESYTQLQSISVDRDSDNQSSGGEGVGNQLAENIAHCVADVEPSESQNEASPEGEDQPTSLIVTNLPLNLFGNQQMKNEFEGLFRYFEPSTRFYYLKSFRRARVDFSSNQAACNAKTSLHHTPFGSSGEMMNCFYGQFPIHRTDGNKRNRQYLPIPPPVRQFLISPPASPPVDWAPGPETQPVVNFDLLSALASLGPGDKYELLPAENNKPGIVVHISADMEVTAGEKLIGIAQTSCPKRN